jgi:hypothetical protein
MITTFNKYRKSIASFLFVLFYLELCLPIYANNRRLEEASFRNLYHSTNNDNSKYTVNDALNKYAATLAGNTTKKQPAIINHPIINNSTTNHPIRFKSPDSRLSGSRLVSGGPGQPEMQSFQSVGTSNMVDLFSGDFSYNIPLLDVGGYPVNIHYRSGISMDQEASWVGLGWNISPGSVNRNMRGVPDDFNGQDQIEKTTSIRPNWTAGANVGLNPEIFGKDLKDILGAGAGIFYNNYRGIGIEAGVDITLQAGKGSKSGLTAGLGLGLNNNSQSGLTIEPSFELTKRNKDANASGWQSTGFSISPSFSTRSGLQSLTISAKGTQKYKDAIKDAEGNTIGHRSGTAGNSSGGTISFAHQSYTPAVTNSFTSLQFNFSVKLGGAAVGFHPLGSVSGYFSTQYIAKEDQTYSVPAYGYLHYSKSRGVANALLDFNREKELPYRESPSTPHLAIPSYTYDIYSINGEGTGGMFRPYRGDIGYVRDHEMASKSISAGGAIDLGGLPNAWHGGLDIRGSYAATTGRAWTLDNELQRQIQFKDADSTFEPVYFRNPGEKTINTQDFYDKIGDTDPILPVMTAYDDPTLTPFMQRYKGLHPTGVPIKFDAATTYKNNRDKRSQVISYLTANEADSFGLEKKIVIIPENKYFIGKCDSIQCDKFGCVQIVKEKRNDGITRKGHHISEINVLNADGRKYVYGLPVYNLEQQEVSFAANKANADVNTGLVGYTPGSENSTDNKEGKDRYYSKEKIPAYAHSFLLTGIVSSDYVDRLEDGITDDDQGDAIKFNYTRVFDNANPFQWRTPFEENKATYNEGLKTDYKDDKGSYIYGKKEIWYLNSVESKAMVATFEINDPSKGDIRKDGYAVKGENGGRDLTKSLRYLKRINLYTKADYIQNGVNALPIKTVNFEYTYELCKGYPAAADASTGKLTLKKIWFTYNKNNKNKQNPYLFYYHPTDLKNGDTTLLPAYNPGYDNKAYDRWGNYKNATQNPAGMTNADYPYTIEDSTIAANNARVWTLSDIQLPSGGRLNVEYESDDYAYVQNKRAAQLYQLAGIGDNSDLAQAGNNLYSTLGGDYRYVFIKVPGPIQSKQDIYKKWLAGVNKLYFRMQVKMPKDIYGEGFENVTTYAQYEDYGTTTDNTVFWIKLKGTHLNKAGDGDRSPLAKTAIQALKLNLPSKAYPGSDLDGSESLSPEGLIKMMVGFTMNFSSLFVNFATQTRLLGRAREIWLQNSFVRLNNTNYRKFGGGLRVKRVTVYDSWDKMTGQKEAKYGQEYDYTTLKEIDGQITRISSGVASFEPTIGNDENPFREPIEYDEQIAPLAPSNNMYSEYPLGESFFPSASVGYSKIRVHTINAKNVKSATGYQETEFYTTYDFPTITDRTELSERKFKSGFLESLFRINALRYLAQTQGFKVETNDMNGREKGMASYPETDPYNAISYTKYFYKVDNEDAEFKHLNNTVMTVDSVSGKINPTAQVGKDVEVMVDLRENFSETIGGNLEFNVDGFVLGIIPVGVPMVWAYPQYEANRYRSAATLKVVQRYGILDKVMHYEKGSLITTENVLYDGETGDVVLTKTQNEFNDPVYNFSYPAHWAYTGMGPAYQNIGATFNGIRITDGKIVTAGIYKSIERFFESGDEVIVRGINRKVSETENKDCDGNNLTCRTDVFSNIPFTEKLWAINAAKIQNRKNKTGIHFIDKEGKFFTANTPALSLTILRSGKRNMPATPISAITSLSNPLQNINGVYKLILNDSTRVINTSATSFKDFWRVEDVKYQKDTILVTKTKVSNEVTIYPTNNYLLHHYHLRIRRIFGICDPDPPGFETTLNPPFVEAQRQNPTRCDDEHNARSIIEFDLSAIPAGATISSAFIYLPPHDSVHIKGNGDFNHATLQPHRYDNFNGGSNEFQLSRITDNWYNNPANLIADPKRAFNFEPAQDITTAVVVPGNIKPNISYYKDVTAMMQAMSNNRTQPAQIGMKMTTSGDGNRNRVCIQAKQGVLKEGNIDGLSIKIKYHTCTNGQTLTKGCDDYYCYKYDTTKICLSYLQDTSVNPYRWGILGNWRTDRAYTYYEKRRESDPDQETNIRKDGVLAKFVPYWNFGATTLTATVDTFHWVWNSEMTLFNRKGFEIENRDPLGRHNALLYGYNQTLPVTVAQNSKYREQAYEGFEDFGYQNDKCGKPCTVPRHLDISLTDTRITNTQAHTGRYSLGVTNSDSLLINVPVSDSITDQKVSDLTIRIDTTVITGVTVTPKGLGMNANYYGLTSTDYLNTQVFKNNNFVFPGTSTLLTAEDINFNFPAGTPNPKAGARSQYYGVKWNGLIQAAFTGEYQFRLATNNGGYLKIGTTPFDQVLTDFPNDPSHVARYSQVMKIKLRAGVLYSIEAGMEQGNDAVDPRGNTGHRAVLEWAVPGSSVFNVVGKRYYYKTLADTLGSVVRTNTNCIKMQDIRASKNIIYNRFSPLQKTRLLVSAWLKEEKDCKCETYENSLVRVAFFDVNNNLLRDSLFKPTGNIIDGWQRLEEYFTLPAGAVTMKLSVRAGTLNGYAGKVFVDDIRIHPFLSNMKSYVYDPVSLRLMSELDENNYATFYEYDDDGTLIRVKKETERGIKTINETRSALIK